MECGNDVRMRQRRSSQGSPSSLLVFCSAFGLSFAERSVYDKDVECEWRLCSDEQKILLKLATKQQGHGLAPLALFKRAPMFESPTPSRKNRKHHRDPVSPSSQQVVGNQGRGKAARVSGDSNEARLVDTLPKPLEDAYYTPKIDKWIRNAYTHQERYHHAQGHQAKEYHLEKHLRNGEKANAFQSRAPEPAACLATQYTQKMFGALRSQHLYRSSDPLLSALKNKMKLDNAKARYWQGLANHLSETQQQYQQASHQGRDNMQID
jgi:hypothetical protein